MKFGLSLFILIGLLCSSALGQGGEEQSARIQGFTIHADSMDRDSESEIVDLEGNVQVIYQDQHLSCKKARINLRGKSIDAIGDVIITTPKATISGLRVILDYESNSGLILEGFVQSGNVIFEGKQIHKISDSEYIADNARFTTCTTCPEAWNFSGSKIRAEIGGYAYIKNSLLHFGGIPVFWMPYLVVPLKSDRQSGLLTPGFEVSTSGGLAFSQSFFWAMSRSQDSTWTLKNYEFRGLKGLLNYRYMLSPVSYGDLDMGYLRDRVFAESSRLNSFRSANSKSDLIDRWFLKYQHYYEMPDGIVHRAQLNNSSDLQYPNDFPLETLNLGDSAIENRTSVSKNTDNQHYSLDASYYRNLQQTNPLGGNEDAVHRLPELRFSQVNSRIGDSDFIYSFDADYVNFARSSFAYDDLNAGYDPNDPNKNKRHIVAGGGANCTGPEWESNPECFAAHDGSFDQNKDLIRTGQRLDLKPSLYRPIKFENWDLLPKISYRDTQYTFPVGEDSHATRRSVQADLSARTTYSRIYGDFSKLQSDRIKHEIQPEISGTAIPWIDHPKNPFFGYLQSESIPFSSQDSVSDSDLNGPAGLQFDYNDRVYNRKLITFGLTNKFTRKSWTSGAPVYLQFLNWKLAQSFDVYSSERNPNGQPLSDLLSDLRVTLSRFQIYQRANYYPYQRVTNTSTRLRATDELGDFFQTEHILSYAISPGKDVDVASRKEALVLSAKKSIRWIDFIGKLTYDLNPIEKSPLQSWGYGAQIKVPGDCLYFNIINYQIPDGDRNFQLNVAFIWDGKEKPALSESLLTRFNF